MTALDPRAEMRPGTPVEFSTAGPQKLTPGVAPWPGSITRPYAVAVRRGPRVDLDLDDERAREDPGVLPLHELVVVRGEPAGQVIEAGATGDRGVVDVDVDVPEGMREVGADIERRAGLDVDAVEVGVELRDEEPELEGQRRRDRRRAVVVRLEDVVRRRGARVRCQRHLQVGLFVAKFDPDFYSVEHEPGRHARCQRLLRACPRGHRRLRLRPLDRLWHGLITWPAGSPRTTTSYVQWRNSRMLARSLVIEVQYAGSASNCNSYGLVGHRPRAGRDTRGINFCGPVLNSTGVPGASALGSSAVIEQDLALVGQDLPLLSNGYFLVSPNAGTDIANPAARRGTCASIRRLGATSRRRRTPVERGRHHPGGPDEPAPNGAVVVQPGETWRFQLWYRDAVLGVATSNFTDAVAVTFH